MNITRQFLPGRYHEGKSAVHSLDTRVKVFFLILMSVSLFVTKNLIYFIYPFILLILCIFISRIKFLQMFKGMAFLLWLVLTTFILHSLIPPRNIEYSLEISLRLMLLFSWATLLTATTSAIKLSAAVAWYAGPLKVFGISSANVARTFYLSLKFFPIILEEASGIIKSQRLKNDGFKFRQKVETFCIVFIRRVLKKTGSMEFPLTLKPYRFSKLSIVETLVMIIGIIHLTLLICV